MEVLNTRLAKNDSVGAAETCNELARIYLESGDLGSCLQVVQDGLQHGLQQTGLTDADKNLWLFRWENAQARVAARQGKTAEAQQHVAAGQSRARQNQSRPGGFIFI